MRRIIEERFKNNPEVFAIFWDIKDYGKGIIYREQDGVPGGEQEDEL